MLRDTHFLFCWECLRKTGIGVLYSYDNSQDRFTSIYLSFNTKKSHVIVGIRPYLDSVMHIITPKKKFKEITKEYKLNITIPDDKQPNPYVTIHPHTHVSVYRNHMLNPELKFTITTLLTPDNIRDKVSLYLLMS